MLFTNTEVLPNYFYIYLVVKKRHFPYIPEDTLIVYLGSEF